MRSWFVTATGTEVGKTFVCAAVCHQLRANGRTVRALKPVISGYSPHSAAESDSAILLSALGQSADETNIAEISPWRFTAPLSPDMAAAREGRTLVLDDIVAFCRAAQDGPEDDLLIEGVGGAMVPLDGAHTVMDWMGPLDASVLVVGGSYLGTINHCLTTLGAMDARGVRPAALILSESESSPVPLDETKATIARHAGELPIACVPRISGAEEPWAACPDLTALLDRIS